MLGDVQDPKNEALPAAIVQEQARNSTSAIGDVQPLHQAGLDEHFTNPPELTDAQRYQQLVEWNATRADYPHDVCLHQIFETRAEQAPETRAIVYEQEFLTYREVNLRANQLAYSLRSLGVGPDVLVGICMDRCPELVISVLGILKAGGAYMPLDPTYPAERLAFMVEDAHIQALITVERLRTQLPEFEGPVICLDMDWESVAGDDKQKFVSGVTASNLAYVIYTSGSTGKPKGVCCNHRGILNLLTDFQNRQPILAGDNCSFWTSFCFDVSIYEMFSALLHGGTLHIVPERIRLDGMHFIHWLEIQQIHSAYIPPFMLADLRLHVQKEEKTLPLRRLLVGVEPIPEHILAEINQRLPALHIINGYGPTEASICSTLYSVVSRFTRGKNTPIGRPVQNAQIYLLDSSLQPVPPGVPGELHIGGDGLARGYLHRPELTAERFIPNPFSDEPGARLYKTGDLARYLPDGTIEFLGRMDRQVKIRGYRIELDEVEAALCAHPSVREAIVIAHPKAEEKRLAAYIIPRTEHVIVPNELRHYLQQRLPDYMVPSAFTLLAALPLLPNGKLDRKALPAPLWGHEGQEQTYAAPRTPVETLLAETWAEVLSVKRVGLYDDFFSLGGDSLLANQILVRLRAAFHVEIPLSALFEAATLLELAQYIEAASQAQNDGMDASTPAIQAIERELEQQLKRKRGAFHFLPLSPPQQRLWFLDQLEPGNPSYTILTALRLHGCLKVAMLERGLNAIVQRHEILRTSFAMMGDGPVQVIAPVLNLALPVMDLGALAEGNEREAEVQRQAGIETHYVFNLAETPLIRTSLLRLDENEHVLLINMHHIISDGWSFAVLVQELEALYTSFVEGEGANRRVPLPELPIQYADYAVWQREWLEGRQKDGQQISTGETPLKQQLEYWKQQLQGAPGVLELPADHPRPAVQTYQGASETLMLDSSLARGLKTLGQQSADGSEGGKYTLFMTLLAVFQILLSRCTGEEDIVVGAPFANRNRVEIEKLIGFFVNTLGLRTDLSHDPTFRELLKRVRRVCLEAHANQDVPFDSLIEELKPERDLSRTLLFQVFFNLLNIVNYPTRPLVWPGLGVEVYWPHQAGVKFDLTLYVQELDEGIRLEALYNADLFERSRIRELLAQMKYLVEQVIADPDARISQLSLVTPGARLLLPDPGEPLSATWHGSVFSLFAEQAQAAPEHPALVDADGVWSYRNLNEHSNRLANHLLAQGIGPQAVVAIYARRAASLAWAVLGVLKTGAAYMMLDPSYPAARLSEYLRLGRASGFLQLAGTGELPSEVEAALAVLPLRCRLQLPLRPLTGPSAQFTHSSPADPGVVVGPDDIACVAFTSGSTGHPRGILQRHGSLSHFFPWQQQTFGLSAQDRYSMLSGLSHDPLQRDIFTSLCLGATLYIPTQEDITTPGQLARWMRQACLSITHLTPAMLHLLTQSLPSPLARHEMPSLRYAFVVGDVLTKLDIKNLQQIAPAATCVCLYGSTESQRAVGYFVIPPASGAALTEQEAREIIPLGRGCKDVQLLILNRSQRLAGIGEIGEIAIRSPHLAQGYLADDELTRERFIPNLFTHAANDRLYKTGDLGRYLPDGNVEHAGRSDLQVKIRGFRIELAEIEATLLLHPAVREAAVVIREGGSADRSLVAYIVPVGTPTDDTSLEHTLWQFLRTRLPGYMLPAAFTVLEALPLSPNHKVDRHALQALARTSQGRVTGSASARTPEEEIMVGLWKQVLNVEHVGIDENFFELGGHSLLGIQFLARVNEIFHTTLRLRTLFEAPTVASFAAALKQQDKSDVPARTRQPALVPLARPARSVKPLSSHRDGAVSENKE